MEWHLNRPCISSICSPHIVHWMAISTLWMLNTVRLYHQRAPISLPRLPELKKLHRERQTEKIPRNTTKWWRVSSNFALHVCTPDLLVSWKMRTLILEQRRWSMACRRLVGRRWTSTSIHHSGLTLLTTTYMYAFFFWSDVFSPVPPISFVLKNSHPNSWYLCRSRTSGFTMLVLVLSRTLRTASSSRSHGHVFLPIYSSSI